MKKQRKIFIILLVLISVFSFVSCNVNKGEDIAEPVVKNVTLLIVGKDNTELAKYERATTEEYVSDLLLAIVAEENSTFAFECSISAYGQYINTVIVSTDSITWAKTGLFPNAANREFCAFYHTLSDAKYIDYTVEAKTYNNMTFNFAGNGINSTPLINGAVYLFTIGTY